MCRFTDQLKIEPDLSEKELEDVFLSSAQRTKTGELLPANPNECSSESQDKLCFRAGDLRVNEQVKLALLLTIWLREHNRVARTLQQLNPSWSDEILFQEARRIMIAEPQHITYNEFLPLILGPDYMRTFDLQPKQRGYTKLYSPEIDPTIVYAFATAAYRFGHSLVQGVIKLVIDKLQFT
jgi:peroxidase